MVSNRAMENMDDPGLDRMAALARRVQELEIKAGFAEDLLDQLDQTIFRQQRQIEALARELMEMRRRMPEGGASPAGSLRDDVPPHY